MKSDTLTLLQALQKAYLLMLQMPHNMLRINNQETLAAARDAIAQYTGDEPQEVQTSFETKAFELTLFNDYLR